MMFAARFVSWRGHHVRSSRNIISKTGYLMTWIPLVGLTALCVIPLNKTEECNPSGRT